jgi:hypothetical protein
VNALNMIGRGLRRIFGPSQNRRDFLRSPAARAVAEYLSGIEGASLVWCGCGELLAPIVYSEGEQAEIVALGCVHNGCGAVLVKRARSNETLRFDT